MLNRDEFQRLRDNVKAFDNRAVFEIPEILEALISYHRSANFAFPHNTFANPFAPEIHRGM
jgi:hypothetical protein